MSTWQVGLRCDALKWQLLYAYFYVYRCIRDCAKMKDVPIRLDYWRNMPVHVDTLRIALLRTWRDQGLGLPVYGVVDADELATYGRATLAFEGGWCDVTPSDVALISELRVEDVVAADWMDQELDGRVESRLLH